MAKRANIEVVENKISKLDKAIQEIKNGELERYKTFEDFEKSLNV
ncbi:competence protein [Campylobacter blaseri]|uniref:Competence protein n=1 Tax=Campylobacter blaseri TaxID=2042961 RepID=A0A2P8QY89_9BACT|nr:competence protein [Campylobacter blaseri]PSM52110.1 competence protein [Campylobacter blaseri]